MLSLPVTFLSGNLRFSCLGQEEADAAEPPSHPTLLGFRPKHHRSLQNQTLRLDLADSPPHGEVVVRNQDSKFGHKLLRVEAGE
jgi:hypothetical protein